jgi:single-strand selective monofunctional uracil DNA glycosylase
VSLVTLMEHLGSASKRLRFGPPVAYAYHPLDYAWPIAHAYYERYGATPKDVVFLGMNPGPFGMAQTGIPFGEVSAVRDYLGLEGNVKAPRLVHPKRPIEGLACARSEVSGQRLWGAIAARHPSPESFFERAIVLNYCPILFLEESGKNLTPDKLAKEERTRMEALCDASLREVLAFLRPKHVVGIGVYAAKRAALAGAKDVVTMPHPSPASPAANRGWVDAARRSLEDAGLSSLL